MEEGIERHDGSYRAEKDEVFSKVVRAGKRTYFFDVKATHNNDFYITITESKKRFNRDGRYFYEKHKIFLYREDFEKFVEGLSAMMEFIAANLEEDHAKVREEGKNYSNYNQASQTGEFEEEEVVADSYTNLDFEDLESKH
jgi:hypothetical protein